MGIVLMVAGLFALYLFIAFWLAFWGHIARIGHRIAAEMEARQRK